MKKTICKVISVIMCAVFIYAIIALIRTAFEPVYGFVDLSGFVMAIDIAVGIVAAIIAYFTGRIGWK